MHSILYVLIGLFGGSSYLAGLWQIVKGKYKPSLFSRIVWVLLAINSFAGVILSHSTKASIALGAILLAGNITICIASFFGGSREFGKLEIFCLILLGISAVIWVLFNAPLVNLGLSLFAHFVGAAPTYKKVWLKPASESTIFWSLFFVASLLSIVASWPSPIKLIILPVYFTLFDGSMFFLSMRRKKFYN